MLAALASVRTEHQVVDKPLVAVAAATMPAAIQAIRRRSENETARRTSIRRLSPESRMS